MTYESASPRMRLIIVHGTAFLHEAYDLAQNSVSTHTNHAQNSFSEILYIEDDEG